MTVASTTNRVSYAGNGTTTDFAFPHPYRASSDLVVTLRTTATGAEVAQVEGVNYTVSGTPTSDAGGFASATVSFGTAPASGTQVHIDRIVARTQTTDYVAGDGIPPSSIEGSLDKLTQLVQELDSRFERTLLQPRTAANRNLVLPEPTSGTASRVLAVNAGGTAYELRAPDGIPNGDKGDITVSGAGTTWTIDANAVTTTKIADGAVTAAKIGDAELSALAGLTSAANKLPYFTGSGTAALADLTVAGRDLLAGADATAQRGTLGLGTIATQAANNVSITGGSITGITDLAIADGGTGASTAANARTNLGLGTAATVNTGTSGGTIPLLNANNTHSGDLSVTGNLVATNTGNRINQLSIGPDSDILLYEGAANQLNIRYGASGSYNYAGFPAAGGMTLGSQNVTTDSNSQQLTNKTIRSTASGFSNTSTLYIDTTNNFTDRSALITTTRDVVDPTSVMPSLWQLTIGNGNNANFRGVSGGYFKSADRTGITSGQRGVLYGLQLSVQPNFDRNNHPNDDAVGLVVQNEGTGKGTEGIYFGRSDNLLTWDWSACIGFDSPSYVGVYYGNFTWNYGIDACWGGSPYATFNNAFLRTKAGTVSIASRNNAGTADVNVLKYTTGDLIEIGPAATVVVDPQNARLGIGATPSYKLDVNGTARISDATIVEANSTSAALRVTQTGTGNALLVEDSANPDSTPFLIDANGQVAINTTATVTNVPIVIEANSGNAIAAAIKGRSDGIGVLQFTDNSGVENGRIDYRNTLLDIKTSKSSPITFSPNAIEKFRIAPDGTLTIADAGNLAVGSTTGTKIGTATTQKLAFYNATPIVQRAAAAQAAVATTAATQTTPWGFSTQAQADAIITLLNEIRTTLVNLGLMKGSA